MNPTSLRLLTPRCVRLAALALVASLTFGCGSSSSPTGSDNETGTVVSNGEGGFFFVDPNRGGAGQSVRLSRAYFGRLVDVFGVDAAGTRVPMQEDFVMAAGFTSSPGTYLLERSAVSGQETLTILREVADTAPGGGRDQFFDLLRGAEANVTPIFDQGVGGTGLFTMVPRNAAIVLHFDDLLEPDHVSSETIRVLVGVPSVVPFEARILPDPNHGDMIDHDGDGQADFASTRVIIDTTVSQIESLAADPPLPINGVGLPASTEVNRSNVSIRVPTVPNNALGQETVLTNLTDHAVASSGNGSVDFSDPTLPLVRAVRSGGRTVITADPYNGFLRDETPPKLLGSQPMRISVVPVQSTEDPEVFTLPEIRFDSTTCAQSPLPGDVIQQTGVFAEVIEAGGPQVNGVAQDVVVRLLLFPSDFAGPEEWVISAVGEASYLSTYDPSTDAGREACFVQIAPIPSGFPEEPAVGVPTAATFGLRFNEPMDPGSMTAFDSMTLTRVPEPESTSEYIVGTVQQTLDLQEFTFAPSLPLAHTFGMSEEYFVTLATGSLGPTDLAGNALAFSLPQITVSLDGDEATQRNGGRVTRFTKPDEEAPFGSTETGTLPEWGGQLFYDLSRELIRPRPVTRYSAYADRSQAVPALMRPITGGIVTPLSPFGSKLQALWRYVDVGFSLTDVTNHNIDIEGLNWAPAGGIVTADNYEEFEIRLAHAKHAPDEYIDPDTLFPAYPQSGQKPLFSFNILAPDIAPQVVVHPRERGYEISPGDAFIAPTSAGTTMVPWPLNLVAGDPLLFTWRDTSIPDRDGTQNRGVDPDILSTALGIPIEDIQKIYSDGDIQTIGLALLMEFRCYPDDGAQGLNALDISIAVNSSSRPYFRSFTTGGFSSSGVVTIDPDLETTANGGFNPNMGGASTHGLDNAFYMGGMDLVVRVSRAVSIWFEADDPAGGLFTSPTFNVPVVEPAQSELPLGTSVELHFRGASAVSNLGAVENANEFDVYGNFYTTDCAVTDFCHDKAHENPGITFLNGNDTWKPLDLSGGNPLGIDGARFYQIRVTFRSNVQTGLTPELSALALSWRQP